MNAIAKLLTATALSMSLGGCLFSMLGKVSDSKIVKTDRKNPEGMETFFRGAVSLGCSKSQTSNGNWYVDCPPNTVGAPAKVSFGFQERARNLTIGCDHKQPAYCDEPIKAILVAGDGSR